MKVTPTIFFRANPKFEPLYDINSLEDFYASSVSRIVRFETKNINHHDEHSSIIVFKCECGWMTKPYWIDREEMELPRAAELEMSNHVGEKHEDPA